MALRGPTLDSIADLYVRDVFTSFESHLFHHIGNNGGNALFLIMLAVAGLGTPLPVESDSRPRSHRWEALRAQDLRVAAVSYRLSTANRAACGSAAAPQRGFVLHSLDQYGPSDRADATRNYGLGTHVGVLAVVSGSPAERAGLRNDDQLVSVNGRMLNTGATPGSPTRQRVEDAQRVFAAEMGTGSVTLDVLRADQHIEVTFTAASGCSSDVELVPGGDVNAWADGKRVVIGGGILARCPTDDDLALVIAHEMAHNILHHQSRLAWAAGSGSGRLGLTGDQSAAMRKTEEEADTLAVGLTARASYSVRNAEAFLGELLTGDGAVRAAATHPDTKRRLELLRVAVRNLLDVEAG